MRHSSAACAPALTTARPASRRVAPNASDCSTRSLPGLPKQVGCVRVHQFSRRSRQECGARLAAHRAEGQRLLHALPVSIWKRKILDQLLKLGQECGTRLAAHRAVCQCLLDTLAACLWQQAEVCHHRKVVTRAHPRKGMTNGRRQIAAAWSQYTVDVLRHT